MADQGYLRSRGHGRARVAPRRRSKPHARSAALGGAALAPLMSALGDPRAPVRMHAARAVAWMDDPVAAGGVVQRLMAMLADPDAEVRRVDRRRAGHPEGRARRRTRSCARLKDQDARVRAGAAAALGGLERVDDWTEPRGRAEGFRVGGAAGSGARARHARAEVSRPRPLGCAARCGRPRAPDGRLGARTARGSGGCRSRSSAALARRGAAGADSRRAGRSARLRTLMPCLRLTAALKDGSAKVRETSAWALGQIEQGIAVDPLATALADQDWRVRKTAAWALGQIEQPRAVPALVRATADEHVRVRETSRLGARTARGRAGGSRADPPARGSELGGSFESGMGAGADRRRSRNRCALGRAQGREGGCPEVGGMGAGSDWERARVKLRTEN